MCRASSTAWDGHTRGPGRVRVADLTFFCPAFLQPLLPHFASLLEVHTFSYSVVLCRVNRFFLTTGELLAKQERAGLEVFYF